MSRNPKPTSIFNRAPADHVDWSKARRVRLPVSLLERIKVAANKRDVPYQSLIKTWLAEKTGTS